jgi:DNA-binding NtrC family response regulator
MRMVGGMVGVLLVEDDPAIADIYAFKLRLDGFSVAVAGDRPVAEECFWRDRPAVVCLDEWLPDGSGTELAERFAAAGALVVLFTNDQRSYERPPPGICRALLKARTNPVQLSAAISELVGRAPASA